MTPQDLTGIGEIHALLGRGSRFEGKLTFQGRVRIDGEFSGEIFSDDVLIIGEESHVQANIDVGTLIIRGGSLKGNVRATQLVEIYAPARVYCDIHTPQLFLDKGVVFEGNCSMLEKEDVDVDEVVDGEVQE